MTTAELSPQEAQAITIEATKFFKPASPITLVEFFSGRIDQLARIYEAIFQEGQHVVLYGERGVGKTSLANIIGPYAEVFGDRKIATAKINCDSTDTFSSVWKKILDEISWTELKQSPGFAVEKTPTRNSLAAYVGDEPSPNDIRRLLGNLANPIVLVFDEFDRLPRETSSQFTDVVKALSDHSVASTVIMVGVSDTVGFLIEDHASIDRALVQVPLPRMSDSELRQILEKAEATLKIDINSTAISTIVKLSQGLPHYTHLVGLASVKDALRASSRTIGKRNVEAGLNAAVADAQQSIKSAYHKATMSSHKEALFKHVLTACALAKKDELSYFRAADVVPKISEIMRRKYDIPAFARHLKEFCSVSRGNILESKGGMRAKRYRFANPLMEPYVVMHAISTGLITG